VAVRRARDVEAVRLRELRLVEVAGGVPDRNLVPGLDRLPVHLVRARGRAAEVMHRMPPAEQLVGGGRSQLRVGNEPCALLGVLEQRKQAEAERVAGDRKSVV